MSGPRSPLEVLGVDNAMLAVGDFEQAVEFYGGRLGLPLKFELPEKGIAGFRLGPEEPGLVVHVRPVVPEAPRDTPRLWLEVRDARAAAAELRARGVAPLEEPFEVATGWTVELADPWGNVIGLTDYTKSRSRGRPAR
jgi:predicted enzyme related to lactoylglutathione lyase